MGKPSVLFSFHPWEMENSDFQRAFLLLSSENFGFEALSSDVSKWKHFICHSFAHSFTSSNTVDLKFSSEYRFQSAIPDKLDLGLRQALPFLSCMKSTSYYALWTLVSSCIKCKTLIKMLIWKTCLCVYINRDSVNVPFPPLSFALRIK